MADSVSPFIMTTESCGVTPSMFGNNLTCSTNVTAYASRNKVRIINNAQSTASDGPTAAVITYIKYIQLHNLEWVLCLGSNLGSQIYNEDGSCILHIVPIEDQPPPQTELRCHRAVCSLSMNPSIQQLGREIICFGDHAGKVETVAFRSMDQNFATLSPAIEGFGPGITCMEMCRTSGELICGYDDGTMLWWSVDLVADGESCAYGQIHSDKFEDCPVGIVSTGISLAVAFGSGRIRVFTGKMRLAEIAAHARWITGMTCLPAMQMVATVSEDTVLNVWQLSDDVGVELVHSGVVTDKQLTGVSFVPKATGCELAVVAYDSDLLYKLNHPAYN